MFSNQAEIKYADLSKQVFQFDLASLLTLVTVSAVISAIASPFIAAWTDSQRNAVGFIMLFYFVGFVIGWLLMGRTRRMILKRCGRRVANAISDHGYLNKQPLLKAIFLSMLLSLQLLPLFSAAFQASKFINSYWIGFWFSFAVIIGVSVGYQFYDVLAKACFGPAVFCEHGVVIPFQSFVAWSQIKIRESDIYADGVRVAVSSGEHGVNNYIFVARLSSDDRTKVLSLAESLSKIIS